MRNHSRPTPHPCTPVENQDALIFVGAEINCFSWRSSWLVTYYADSKRLSARPHQFSCPPIANEVARRFVNWANDSFVRPRGSTDEIPDNRLAGSSRYRRDCAGNCFTHASRKVQYLDGPHPVSRGPTWHRPVPTPARFPFDAETRNVTGSPLSFPTQKELS